MVREERNVRLFCIFLVAFKSIKLMRSIFEYIYFLEESYIYIYCFNMATNTGDSNMTQTKPILAIDIDETIAQLMPSLISFHSETYGEPHYHMDHFHTLAFHEVWGGTPEETTNKIEEYYLSPHFKAIQPIPEAKEYLLDLKSHFDLHVVTARGHNVREETINWLNTHYTDIFKDFHFGNLYGINGIKKKKSQLCQEIGALALVDDSFHYATDCAENGIPVILFGKYAWNKYQSYLDNHHEEHDLIERATQWAEVHDILMKKFKK